MKPKIKRNESQLYIIIMPDFAPWRILDTFWLLTKCFQNFFLGHSDVDWNVISSRFWHLLIARAADSR